MRILITRSVASLSRASMPGKKEIQFFRDIYLSAGTLLLTDTTTVVFKTIDRVRRADLWFPDTESNYQPPVCGSAHSISHVLLFLTSTSRKRIGVFMKTI